MNRIEVIRRKSDFIEEAHLDIAVDGTPLSEALCGTLGARACRGLVPCLLPWYEGSECEQELRISRERFFPDVGTAARAPVLMCPDDCDYAQERQRGH